MGVITWVLEQNRLPASPTQQAPFDSPPREGVSNSKDAGSVLCKLSMLWCKLQLLRVVQRPPTSAFDFS